MGNLSKGHPLTWQASAPYRDKVKRDGIAQFLAAYRATAGRVDDALKWGDEIEYTLVVWHPDALRLSLRAPEIITELGREEHLKIPGASVETLWRPEYATWMVEGTPGAPYRCYVGDLILVEMNMRLRRKEIEKLLAAPPPAPDGGGPAPTPGTEWVLTMPAFPRLGCPGSTHPPDAKLVGQFARSLYLPDTVINPHPRFGTLTRNIRTRRGRKVEIRVPLLRDEKTPEAIPVLDVDDPGAICEDDVCDGRLPRAVDTAFDCPKDLAGAMTDDIYMDCMAFGMGLSCLQVTLQARDMEEARYLYDQLAVLAPIFLSLTAATPALRGYLSDHDVRWNVISAAVDDRTEEEMGYIPKSRYSSIDLFISNRPENKAEEYNDLQVDIHKEAYQRLIDAGIDDRLATHVAHLFIRDPLVIYKELVDQDTETSTDHFENIQSTNWNTVRFKVPPPQSEPEIGWRTEFRPMEVQFTDFENAAFAIFIVLVSRVIVAFDLNFYTAMSKVDENMDTAHERDSVTEGRFHFRKNIFHRATNGRTAQSFVCSQGHMHHPKWSFKIDSLREDEDPDATEMMSIDTIINGTLLTDDDVEGYAFPGLLPLVRGYLDSLPDLPLDFRSRLEEYFKLISGRARGDLWTGAKWMRKFVQQHPDYGRDSKVTDKICQDLVTRIHRAGQGNEVIPEMMGDVQPGSVGCHDATDKDCIESLRKKAEDSFGLPGQSLSESVVDRTFERIALNRSNNGSKK